MQGKNKFEFKVSTGITSILMIFVILTLTAFGVLSYVSANADYKLSVKNAENIKNYYFAESKVMENLVKIDEAVCAVKNLEGFNGNFYERVREEVFESVKAESFDVTTGEVVISSKIDKSRSISLKIKINENTVEKKNYKILEYNVKMN